MGQVSLWAVASSVLSAGRSSEAPSALPLGSIIRHGLEGTKVQREEKSRPFKNCLSEKGCTIGGPREHLVLTDHWYCRGNSRSDDMYLKLHGGFPDLRLCL